MPLPLVGVAVAAAARIAAKKLAQEAAKKAAQQAIKKKTAQIASNSVKTAKLGPAFAAARNQGNLMKTTDAATGAAARKGAAQLGVTGKKGVQPPVKINSAVKSTPATKVGAKAIKAANKPTRASRTRSGNKAK
jgi:hypothetical protein